MQHRYTDLTQALAAEQAGRAELLDAMSSIVITVRRDGSVDEWNRGAASVLGLVRSAATGRNLRELSIPWETESVLALVERAYVSPGVARLDDSPYQRADGSPGWLGLTATAIGARGGAPELCLILGADITQRRRFELEHRRAEKMGAVGQLAAGMAHELNTPMQFMSNNLQFVREALGDLLRLIDAQAQLQSAASALPALRELAESTAALGGEIGLEELRKDLPEAITASLQGLSRISEIVAAIEQLASPGDQERSQVDINGALRSAVVLAQREWKDVATVEWDLDAELPPAPCFGSEIHQVFLNLVLNACHAMQDARASDPERPGVLRIRSSATPSTVEVRISDTGTGIREEIRERVFEPFFTTKSVGRGRGQGLYIAYQAVVKRHGGALSFETVVGSGTTFIVRLPTRS